MTNFVKRFKTNRLTFLIEHFMIGYINLDQQLTWSQQRPVLGVTTLVPNKRVVTKQKILPTCIFTSGWISSKTSDQFASSGALFKKEQFYDNYSLFNNARAWICV